MVNKIEKKKILADHLQIGKKFIPKWITEIGNLKEVSWVKQGIPQVIWISELHANLGVKRGVKLCEIVSRAAIKVSKENIWYVSMNDFLKLDETQKEEMQKDLKEMDEYNELLDSLSRIQYFYPENPLSFIFDGNQPIIEDEQESLNKFEIELEKLFDKTSRESALVHGTTMYLVSVSGKLFLQKGSILGNFTVIEHYPNSEKSRKVAAAVRAFITNFIGMNDDEDQEGWSNYFWNRGLQIAECSIERSIPNEN